MKITLPAVFLLHFAAFASAGTTSLASQAAARVVEICGDLGVMAVSPDVMKAKGVGPAALRMCADHPNGREIVTDPAKGASVAPMNQQDDNDEDPDSIEGTSSLVPSLSNDKRACYKKAPYGCSGGYCWKACGDTKKGEWCWTAGKAGVGGWKTCSKWQDCGTGDWNYGCGVGCLFSCGCSC